MLHPPHVRKKIIIGSREYLVPMNPYEAMYFLPSGIMRKMCTEHLCQINYDIYATDLSISMIREYRADLWMDRVAEKVIPLEEFESFLVQHMGKKYWNVQKSSSERGLRGVRILSIISLYML